MTRNNQTKVAICIPNMIIGGVETVFVNTMNELIKNPELDIQIITHAKVREPLYVDWFNSHSDIPVFVYYPLANWFGDLAPKCHGIFKLLRKIVFSLYKKYRRIIVKLSGRFNKVDVFIDYKNMEFFKELKCFSQYKIAWLHSAPSYFEKNGSFSRLLQYDKIVAITDEFIDEFRKTHPKYADKIVRIYNAININAIRERATDTTVPTGKYFAHTSRLVAGKDIKTLLDAFDVFWKSHTDVNLYIVGDGDMADEFKQYAANLKSHKNVIFTGSMQNPYGIMQGAIANILSSEYEGFGMVLIESMALSVPVISSNYKTGSKEILENGKAGMLFDIGNAKQLTKCMEKIISDTDFSKKIVAQATRSLDRFDPSVIAKQIVWGLK